MDFKITSFHLLDRGIIWLSLGYKDENNIVLLFNYPNFYPIKIFSNYSFFIA